jgi:transposase
VLSRRVLTCLLGVDAMSVRVESVEIDHDEVVVWLRPRSKLRSRCPDCGVQRPGYDRGRARRWRALDFGRTRVFVAAEAPRVACPEHGVVVAEVPWARPGARHTRAFEQLAAWCAVEMSSTAASRLLRCSWRTIGSMVTRVAADMRAGDDGLDGLRRIGMDEISYRRGHRYLFVVVDHDQRRLVWAADKANQASVHAFFDALGPERTAQLTHLSADGAKWLAEVIAVRAPKVVVCADSFHVVRWAMDALDEVRRHTWNEVRVHRGPNKPAIGEGKRVWDAKWALWKNPDRHSDAERGRLAYIAATHPRLHRAWALKEGLRTVFALSGPAGIAALDRWLSWARRCRIPSFVKVAKRVADYRTEIVATLTHRLTNALVESVNTKIRLITRRAFGFRNVHALIALAQLSLGGYRPQLPT